MFLENEQKRSVKIVQVNEFCLIRDSLLMLNQTTQEKLHQVR